MKTTTEKIKVSFTDDNRNFVTVTGAGTMDQAVIAADVFLSDAGMCVKNGGVWYGDTTTEVDEVITFNVG